MLSDEEFVIQSITINLFYLANIRGYCLRITLSILDKNCVERAKAFVYKTDAIGNTFIDQISGYLPEFPLNSDFLVTKFTLDCEYLTEKLFNIDLDTGLTEKLLQLKNAEPQNVNSDVVDLMMQTNKATYALAQEFLVFLKDTFEREKNNEFFSYSSPYSIKEYIRAIDFYSDMLSRTIKRMSTSPTFISSYEYRVISFMRNIAIYIAAMVNPSREDIYIKANSFSVEFLALKKNYIEKDLNPEAQKTLNTRTKKVVTRFSSFMHDVIYDILNSNAYFMLEPIFLDDFYRAANYFIYTLTLIENAAKKY